jgi:hypothetical protein
VVLQIDEDGDAPDVLLGEDTAPCLRIRLQPMSGGLCRLSFASTTDDDGERCLIDFADVPEKIATTSTSLHEHQAVSMLMLE